MSASTIYENLEQHILTQHYKGTVSNDKYCSKTVNSAISVFIIITTDFAMYFRTNKH
jgi:hypothetical protein